jgi:hypothetical protein
MEKRSHIIKPIDTGQRVAQRFHSQGWLKKEEGWIISDIKQVMDQQIWEAGTRRGSPKKNFFRKFGR